METQTKKLLALCQQHYPSHNWRARRDQGRIFCNTIPIAKLELTSMDAATVIRWNQDVLANVPVDRSPIAAEFAALYKAEDT
eukprot:934390-Pyramimonas_sp.AAC.1